jgi:HlyD family secretion protein
MAQLTLSSSVRRWLPRLVGLLVIAVIGYLIWQTMRPQNGEAGIASGNGRIEATEINIATKIPGRLADITVFEGDFVRAGQALAHMDVQVLEAQKRQAEANLQRTQINVGAKQSQVRQSQSDRVAAQAVVAQREAELRVAQKRWARSQALARADAISAQELETDEAGYQQARAALAAAKAQVAAAEAAIATAQTQVVDAQAAIEAARAAIASIQADLDDSVLHAPRDGRIQYRVAQPGEVLPAGGIVLNMVDLGDVYMTFFLPTAAAGRVALGTEVHVVLDAAPQYVIPAYVSFVSDVAQFTPKTVETAEERQKLMFRIKAKIDPELLRQHIRNVKTGLPGMAYVRLDPQIPWPPHLQIRLPR